MSDNERPGHDRTDPILRTVPRPADINANGHIFGGWVLSQMDTAGGIFVSRRVKGRCATVAIESMEFIAPIMLGDLVSIYASTARVGRTSIAVKLDVIATRHDSEDEVKVTEGVFTFVAMDDDFRPRPVDAR